MLVAPASVGPVHVTRTPDSRDRLSFALAEFGAEEPSPPRTATTPRGRTRASERGGGVSIDDRQHLVEGRQLQNPADDLAGRPKADVSIEGSQAVPSDHQRIQPR